VSAKALYVLVSGMAQHFSIATTVLCSTLQKFFTAKRSGHILMEKHFITPFQTFGFLLPFLCDNNNNNHNNSTTIFRVL